MIKIGLLRKITRIEEKLLMEEMRRRRIKFDVLDDRRIIADLNKSRKEFPYDVILERSVAHESILRFLSYFNNLGIPTVNSYEVANACGDKVYTSNLLRKNNIPQPRYGFAINLESTLRLCEDIGYPIVIKPTTGSWGRGVKRLDNKDEAKDYFNKIRNGNNDFYNIGINEIKKIVSPYYSVFLIQEYINKEKANKNRDIRSFVIGNEVICAIYRTSSDWITNTTRGGKASNCPVNRDLEQISLAAAEAVGSGIVAIDIFESPKHYHSDSPFLVNEVNYTMEFRNSISITRINIPEKIIDYVVEVANGKHKDSFIRPS